MKALLSDSTDGLLMRLPLAEREGLSGKSVRMRSLIVDYSGVYVAICVTKKATPISYTRHFVSCAPGVSREHRFG